MYNASHVSSHNRSNMSGAERRIQDAAIKLFSEKGSNHVSVSELAQAAGVARGTVYNNIDDPRDLFERIATDLAEEMHRRVIASFGDVDDPAQRLANDIRFFVRRAHEEPAWGWFVYRFAFSNDSLRGLLSGSPMGALAKGRASRRYDVPEDQLPNVMAMIAGTTLTSMWLVLDGHQSWRQAGSSSAELVLRSLGLPAAEAKNIAEAELPPLPSIPETTEYHAEKRASA